MKNEKHEPCNNKTRSLPSFLWLRLGWEHSQSRFFEGVLYNSQIERMDE